MTVVFAVRLAVVGPSTGSRDAISSVCSLMVRRTMSLPLICGLMVELELDVLALNPERTRCPDRSGRACRGPAPRSGIAPARPGIEAPSEDDGEKLGLKRHVLTDRHLSVFVVRSRARAASTARSRQSSTEFRVHHQAPLRNRHAADLQTGDHRALNTRRGSRSCSSRFARLSDGGRPPAA